MWVKFCKCCKILQKFTLFCKNVQNIAFDYLDAPVIRINTADTPAPYSPSLLKEWLPNHNDVIKAVNKVLYK